MKKRTKFIGTTLLLIAVYVVYSWSLIGNYKDKLWSHRCNSAEKYHEQKRVYSNIEVDLVYRGGSFFDVTHDFDTSYEYPFDSILAPLSDDEGCVWADLKNLTLHNALSVANQLDSLLKRWNFPCSRLIVESRDIDALAILTRAGYYTSYYVDFPHPSDLSENQLHQCLDSINDIAASGKLKAISFPAWWYGPIRKKVCSPVDFLTWKHRTTQFEFFLLPWNRRLLQDSQLKVILLKSKGKYHR